MDSKLDSKIVTVIIILACTILFSNSIEIAQEGASLLAKSKGALFPFNILYYYAGISQLSSAVSKDPTNLDVRLIRSSALFDFVENNPVAQDTVQEDLEFFLMFKDKYKYSTKVNMELVYYMLSYTCALKKDYPKFYYYLDKLTQENPTSRLIEKLKNRFPKLFQSK